MLERLTSEKKFSSVEIDEFWEIPIKYGSQIFVANNVNRTLMIGRRPGCDITFDEKLEENSRLHAIVYFLPELNLTAIVDPGSLHGIETMERNPSLLPEHSTPTARKIILLEHGEYAKLKFCEEQIIISPKLCIICLAKPRDHLFNCNHYATCATCSATITTCPLCRKEITSRHSIELNQTNAG